jgi:ethanolamine utilization protein EutQ
MPTLVPQPTRIRAAGTKPKLIDEYIGRVNTTTPNVSVAHMRSPQGWEEPGQTPDFEELTIVLKGTVQVKYQGGQMHVKAGQAVIAHAGEWIQYSTPEPEGAEYIAVCLPAFSMETVHRDQ